MYVQYVFITTTFLKVDGHFFLKVVDLNESSGIFTSCILWDCLKAIPPSLSVHAPLAHAPSDRQSICNGEAHSVSVLYLSKSFQLFLRTCTHGRAHACTFLSAFSTAAPCHPAWCVLSSSAIEIVRICVPGNDGGAYSTTRPGTHDKSVTNQNEHEHGLFCPTIYASVIGWTKNKRARCDSIRPVLKTALSSDISAKQGRTVERRTVEGPRR